MASHPRQGPPRGEARGRTPRKLPRALTGALITIVLALAGGLGASPATGVPPERCDAVAGPGQSAPDLLDRLGPGQTGCFRAGTYKFSLLGINSDVTLGPYGRQRVTLQGEIKVRPSGAGSTIQGMTLDGRGGDSRIGPRIYADRVTLRNNEITNHHTSICVQIGSWYDGPPPRGVVIERNRIHDCGERPTTNKDHGVYVSEARNTVIRDNWIYDNVDRGIQLYHDADGSKVTGNVILQNGDGIVINADSSDNEIYGNIIFDSVLGWNVYGGNDGSGSNNYVHNNCLRALNPDPDYNVNGGIQPEQLHFRASHNRIAPINHVFVNRKDRDLRMQYVSACRGIYMGTLSLPWAPKR
jgi:parallel beta-helix repeat protein